MYRFIFLLATTLFSLMMNFAYADTSMKLVSSEEIKGLKQAIAAIKSHTKHPIPFPNYIPKSDQPLFAVETSYKEKPNYDEYWMITITTDPKCVTKGCVIGLLSASSTDRLDFEYIQAPFDQNMKSILKDKIALNNGITAYYTPGHPEADWHPPTLEWQQDGVLYLFSWDLGENAKQVFTTIMK